MTRKKTSLVSIFKSYLRQHFRAFVVSFKIKKNRLNHVDITRFFLINSIVNSIMKSGAKLTIFLIPSTALLTRKKTSLVSIFKIYLRQYFRAFVVSFKITYISSECWPTTNTRPSLLMLPVAEALLKGDGSLATAPDNHALQKASGS